MSDSSDPPPRRQSGTRLSRGFVAALVGIAMTLLAWFGPWAWPAAPAFALLQLVFGNTTGWLELEYGEKAAVLLLLIAANVSFWAGAWRLLTAVTERFSRSRAPRPS